MNLLSEEIIYGRQALALGEPWIVPASLDLVKSVLRSDWNIFEWGTGGSTVFWSKQCASIITVEHLDNWVERTSKLMKTHECEDNWEIIFAPRDESKKVPYAIYADAILDYEDESFDLISVDGDAFSRNRCIENSLSKLKSGGYLLLDNSNWYADQTGWKKWEFSEKELHWVGQEKEFEWWTTILRKK